RLNFIFDQRRVAGCRRQALPGLRVEVAARLDSVSVLKRGDRLLIVAPGLAVDLAGREAGTIEQYLGLDKRSGVGWARASLAGGRGRLRRIDGLRIERRSSARLSTPLSRLSARRIRHHQDCAGADESHSHESADGHADRRKIGAQLAPAPPPERTNPVVGARTGGPEDVIEHGHGQLLILGRRISAQAHGGGHPLLLDVAERQGEQCPLRSPSARNRSALGARLRWHAASAANVPPRRNAGRHCAKESSHLATLLPSALPPPTLWPRREVIAEAHEFRRRMSQFQSPAFPPRCGKSITVGIDPSSRMQVQAGGRGDEKASGDRVFCHFIDGRSVLRRRLAADGTATLPFGPCHARQLDGHLFWSQRRLRLGAGLIKYRFWWWSGKYPFGGDRIGNSGRRDDGTWPRRDGARWYEPGQLKHSARRHCWRSNRLQLASRNGRLRSRA